MPQVKDERRTSVRNIVLWYVLAGFVFLLGVILREAHHAVYEVTTKTAELIVLAAGLFSVLLVREQLIAQEKQMNENHSQLLADHKWKTFVSYHQLFHGGIPCEEKRIKMYTFATDNKFIKCFDDLGTPMPTEALDKCINETAAWDVVRPYLDEFERFCAAVNAGIIDESYALSVEGTRVIRNFTVFEHLIKHLQHPNGRAYVEIEKIAQKWAMMRRLENEEWKQQIGVGTGTGTRIDGPK